MAKWWRRAPIAEAGPATVPANLPERRGYEPGIPDGGIDEVSQGIGQSTQSDRKSLMQELHDVYAACPWVYTAVQAIARTITAGGMVVDWDSDKNEGGEEPKKPANVRALEAFFAFTNPSDDIIQVMRNAIVSLLVFGDAYLEIGRIAGIPVAIWNMDAPTIYPRADAHGTVTQYVQVTDFGQRAVFAAEDVIHISLDSPRPSVFGFSPTNAALQPITSWLFAAATGKEIYRKGDPPSVHIDFPLSVPAGDRRRWLARFAQTILGPLNIGTPISTVGGATVKELSQSRIQYCIDWLNQRRDEILATFGVPPAMASIIESGNLGGGTGESQRKMFLTNTCQPIAQLLLEKINYAIVRQGFKIDGWHVKFADVDYRDSTVIETIRDLRVRNGSWTLDRYRSDINEPPVPGGSDAVLIDRQNLVLWEDIRSLSAASIAAKGAPAVTAGEQPPNGEPLAGNQDPGTQEDPSPADKLAAAAAAGGVTQAQQEAWTQRYRKQLRADLAVIERELADRVKAGAL